MSAEVVVIANLPLRGGRRRRQRAGARGVRARARRARQRAHHAGPVPATGAVRDRRRQKRRAGVRRPGSRGVGAHRPGHLAGRRLLRRERQRLRLGDLGGRRRCSTATTSARPACFSRSPPGCGLRPTSRRSRRALERDPARAPAGGARAGVLRGAVAHRDDAHHGARRPGGPGHGTRRRARRAEHDVLGGRRALARNRGAAGAGLRRRAASSWRSSPSRCGLR